MATNPPTDQSGFAASLRTITRQQSIDTGMAITLICLLIAIFSSKTQAFLLASVGALLITMTFPTLLKPLAVLWFGFSNRLGKVMSTILLSIIYAVVIVPIGWCRQKLGKDSMQLNMFEQSNTSFFQNRNHSFGKEDLLNPY